MSAPKLATDSFSLSGWSISPPDSKNSSSNSTPKESEEMAEASIPERANKPAVLESLGKSREASGVGYESSLHSTAVRGFVESPISPGEPEILSPKSSGKPDGVKVGEEPEPSKSENDLDVSTCY